MSDQEIRDLQRRAATGEYVEGLLQRARERAGAPRLQEGRRYVMHVIPGTILRATIDRADGKWASIVDAQWLELTTRDGSPWQLATGRPDSEVIRKAWDLADGTLVDQAMIVMASEIQ